ncbi:Sensor-transducer of the stress-activated PKC1-MPK1 kinase pathway [Cyberlindnera jadinii]|uniref:Sensor-transducer of the stress-activated PKC1-MPK1 kinase pathway n=1 Tax=Cyberlindnera jadinii (strain ATCC 18201 / CBS 1600 / BCRC 20928 / JCM 3617 / NBRC 0987 / NRRL Y-1542) TaxID=983966 RepID=A0A0H5C8D9_CYBJN|nr:Sensor-transducer of the stress-activated PKC1-MPK1 kinase pathway [Cyberlindnera jadinii]
MKSTLVSSEYSFQSSSYCESQCANYAYFALTNGGTCICGSSAPTDSTSSSQCNTPCYGYGDETCGGSNAYDVYSNSDVSAIADDSTSSSTTTSGTGATTSTNAQTTSTDGSTTTNQQTGTTSQQTTQTTESTTQSAQQTRSAISTQEQSGSTIVLYSTVANTATATETATKTISATGSTSATSSSSTESSSSASSTGSTGKSSSSSAVGPAVGGAIGGVAALVLIGFAVFFFRRRRQASKERDAELADSAYIGAMKRDNSQLSRPLSNPFLSKDESMVDQRLNPVMLGRRRISEGSLADEADYSRKILRVANPDDDN